METEVLKDLSHFFGWRVGAVHWPDFANVYLESDPLGLRGRVKFFYSGPSFLRAATIRAADDLNYPFRVYVE